MAVTSPPVLAVGSGELFDRWYEDQDVRARDQPAPGAVRQARHDQHGQHPHHEDLSEADAD